MPEVRLSQLTKRYPPDITAVDGLDLTVRTGELLVLVGPSGCGKSTTLRLIAGLERPTEGTIEFDGADVTSLAAGRRNVGMVFQGDNHFPHLSVRDNLLLGLRMRRTPSDVAAQRLEETADALNLRPLLSRWPHELSGGEAQRVALGRVLATRMPLVLLDEPLSNVDPAQRGELRDAIRTLHREGGATLVFVTHDQHEALSLGQRVAVMRGGRLLQVGTPAEIYERPANAFVAGFIGSPPMNLLPAHISDGRLIVADQPLLLAPTNLADGPLTIGVRPERLVISQDAPVTLSATLTTVEFSGAGQVLYLAAGTVRLAVREPTCGGRQPGTELQLGCRREDIYLFAADERAEALGTLSSELG